MDVDDFAEFVAARYAALVRTAFLLTGDRGHAEDLVQAALERTYPKWDKLRAREAAEAYTRTTMMRLAARWSRRRWRGEQPTADLAEGGMEDPDVVAAVDARAALATLPWGQRAVLVLRFFDDLSEARTAEILGCSVGTVKSRTSRALSSLRESGAWSEPGHSPLEGGAR